MGERIRALRTARAMTASELARAAEVTPGLISQVERGITQDTDPERVAVVRRDRGVAIRTPHGEISYQRVTAGAGKIEVLEGLLEAGAVSSETGWKPCVTPLGHSQ